MARAAVEGMAEYGIHASVEDFTPYLGTEKKYISAVSAQMHGGIYSEAAKQQNL